MLRPDSPGAGFDGRPKAELGEHPDQTQIDRRHTEEAVIRGREQAGHHNKRGPGQQLNSRLARCAVSNAVNQLDVERSRVTGGRASGLGNTSQIRCRPGTCAPPLAQPGVVGLPRALTAAGESRQ